MQYIKNYFLPLFETYLFMVASFFKETVKY